MSRSRSDTMTTTSTSFASPSRGSHGSLPPINDNEVEFQQTKKRKSTMPEMATPRTSSLPPHNSQYSLFPTRNVDAPIESRQDQAQHPPAKVARTTNAIPFNQPSPHLGYTHRPIIPQYRHSGYPTSDTPYPPADVHQSTGSLQSQAHEKHVKTANMMARRPSQTGYPYKPPHVSNQNSKPFASITPGQVNHSHPGQYAYTPQYTTPAVEAPIINPGLAHDTSDPSMNFQYWSTTPRLPYDPVHTAASSFSTMPGPVPPSHTSDPIYGFSTSTMSYGIAQNYTSTSGAGYNEQYHRYYRQYQAESNTRSDTPSTKAPQTLEAWTQRTS